MTDKVFCVQCNELVRKDQAHRVFRTGFYKRVTRLGLCSACQTRSFQNVGSLCHAGLGERLSVSG